MNKKSFLIAGGDLRQVYLAQSLSNEYKVYALGFTENVLPAGQIKLVDSITQLNERVDYIVLPLPASSDGSTIAAPYGCGPISIATLLPMLKQSGKVFGGMIDSTLIKLFDENSISYVDYYLREELIVANAVPTAEGTMQIAMEELPRTILGLNVLITGYGRLAKVLLKYFSALGAKVTITARKCADLTWAKIMGGNAIELSKLDDHLREYDLIINTVPAMLFDKRLLSLLKRDALVIDLASKPGGVDFEIAKATGIKTIWALSLPGKVAPVTSGEIIANTILNIITEEGGGDV